MPATTGNADWRRVYVNSKNKVLGLHENRDTNDQRQAEGRWGQKQKEKCGTVEGRLSPPPASTKGNRRSTGKARWIKWGAEVRTRRKHRSQWITETGSYRKEQEAKTITNSNQNEKKRASILP